MPAELAGNLSCRTCQKSILQGAWKSCSPKSVPSNILLQTHMKEKYKEKLLALGHWLLGYCCPLTTHCSNLLLVKFHIMHQLYTGEAMQANAGEAECAAGISQEFIGTKKQNFFLLQHLFKKSILTKLNIKPAGKKKKKKCKEPNQLSQSKQKGYTWRGNKSITSTIAKITLKQKNRKMVSMIWFHDFS